MLTDNYLLLEKPHPSVGGVQRIYRFDNGYGLSVVNGAMLHGYSFAWEIAVLKDVAKDGSSFDLTYDTELTDDIEVFDSDEETNAFIKKAIEALSVL